MVCACCWKLRICLIANSTIWAFVHFWSLSLASWKLGKSDANLSRRALKRDLRSFSYLLNRIALERKFKKNNHTNCCNNNSFIINLLFFTFLGFQRHVWAASLASCSSTNILWDSDIHSAKFSPISTFSSFNLIFSFLSLLFSVFSHQSRQDRWELSCRLRSTIYSESKVPWFIHKSKIKMYKHKSF